MHFTTLIAASFLSLITCAHAATGRAIVTNQCDDPIYLWSVSSSISAQQTIRKDTSYSEEYHTDPVSGGIALKLTSVANGIFTPNVSQIIFAYNLDAATGAVWYDMSALFGESFAGRTIKVVPTDSACESIVWGTGRQPAGSQIRKCGSGADLELSFCSGHCLPSWYPCGNNAQNDTRVCCTHCIGNHHCVAAPAL